MPFAAGRYDGLVELLGGPATTKGIGFGHRHRPASAFRCRNPARGSAGGPARPAGRLDVYLAWFGAAAQRAAVGLARRLRDAGFVVELPAVEMKVRKIARPRDRLKARHAVILGEDELAAGVVAVSAWPTARSRSLRNRNCFRILSAARAASD